MQVFTKFYESKANQLEEMHTAWVQSNCKMNAISFALSQLNNVGDINMSPVLEELKQIQSKEKRRNDELCDNVHALRAFVRDMEILAKEHGLEWHRACEIFGY